MRICVEVRSHVEMAGGAFAEVTDKGPVMEMEPAAVPALLAEMWSLTDFKETDADGKGVAAWTAKWPTGQPCFVIAIEAGT